MDGKRIQVRAVTMGVVFALVTAAFLGVTAWSAFAIADQPPEAMLSWLRAPSTLAGGLLLGLALTVASGSVAARVARERELAHGALTGVALLAVGAVLTLLPIPAEAGPEPAWFDILGMTLTVPAAAFGGYLVLRWRRNPPLAHAPGATGD